MNFLCLRVYISYVRTYVKLWHIAIDVEMLLNWPNKGTLAYELYSCCAYLSEVTFTFCNECFIRELLLQQLPPPIRKLCSTCIIMQQTTYLCFARRDAAGYLWLRCEQIQTVPETTLFGRNKLEQRKQTMFRYSLANRLSARCCLDRMEKGNGDMGTRG